MKKVKMKQPITHQGKSYKPGDVIETTEDHAQELVRKGHAEEHKEDQAGQSGGSSGQPGKDQK